MGRLSKEMDAAERQVGTGWISGMLSLVLGMVGLATVLSLLYPQLLTVADVRGYYHDGYVRRVSVSRWKQIGPNGIAFGVSGWQFHKF